MPAVAAAPGLPSRLGKYELLLPLAAGGMARIYIGRATGIGAFERHVVLKLITPERANDHTAVQMFLDEARLAAALNHQNVAQVFEVGEDSGIHYLAMEYVHGQDSRAVLAKAGSQGTRIPLELALTIVSGAAAGLNHAHERRGPDGQPLGIVHRDVSPSNIMIGYDGAVKLLDFGIAKATARSVETQSGIIKGKFAYMAPEQCRGRDVDRRSDVFSLGIILYEISTQHRCFRADSDFDTMHRIVTGDVVRPTRLIPGYPQALEAIVMKALAVDPAQRYQSAGLLLEAIENFAMASRMAMSTMALGRFMRDMFGEVPEPWLNTAARGSQPVMAKESTISSTHDSGPVRQPVQDTLPPMTLPPEQLSPADGIPDDEAEFPDSGSILGRTVLEIPRGANEPPPEEAPGEWNAKSYPSQDPSLVPGAQPIAHEPAPYPQPAPAMPPSAQPLPPPGAFTPNPGSGSGSSPAHPAAPGQPIVSTRHGYASAAPTRNDVSYPRYEPPQDTYTPDVQLRPNRRPLFIIAIAAVLIVLGIVLVMSMGGGGKDKDSVPAAAPGSDETQMATQPVDQPKSAEPPATADDMVTLHIVSDPKGADVLIAGTKIGVTPLDSKLKRGTKLAQLTVRMAGYQDVTTKIDLSGDYSNDHIKLVKAGEEATGSATQPEAAKPVEDKKPPQSDDKKSTDKTTDKNGDKKIVHNPVVHPTNVDKTPVKHDVQPPPPHHDHDHDPAPTNTPKCQPPGPNVDPFSPIPVCPK